MPREGKDINNRNNEIKALLKFCSNNGKVTDEYGEEVFFSSSLESGRLKLTHPNGKDVNTIKFEGGMEPNTILSKSLETCKVNIDGKDYNFTK